MGLLEGKVVLVTGGGRGIGRETALACARAGARVLVNDLGGGMTGGDEGSTGPAEEVAKLIRDQGGEAASNSDSITDRKATKAMVEQALDVFGGLHAVINPAGVLRDKMFHKMDYEDWDIVLKVHLEGSFNICRAAINHFRDQEDGVFVLFASTSGLIGSIGQANYGSAKMGVAGLSRIIAMEGVQKNVRSNILTPFAATRMTDSIPIKDEATAARRKLMRERVRADQVAQAAVALAAAPREISGQIFCTRGNEFFLMSQPRPIRGIARLEGWTPETILSHAMPALTSEFFDVSVGNNYFSWDPI